MSLTFRVGDRATAEKRLAELILYVTHAAHDDPFFGAIKLNKVLWWADTRAYLELGEPITGVAYRAQALGPVPDPMHAVRSKLVSTGAAEERYEMLGGYEQRRLDPKEPADLRLFDDAQLDIVDSVIESLRGLTGTKTSDLSHGIAWKVAGEGNLIPYESAFLSDEQPTEQALAMANQLIRERC